MNSPKKIQARDGYVEDPVTGELVKAKPETEEAKIVFAQRLITEYGYSRDQIQTWPEFWIQKGSMKIGPADIVVFRDEKKTFDNIYLIVETKRKNREDGEDQLKSYINPTPAEGGVWFNGSDVAYFRVTRRPPSHAPELVGWRNIPKKGQSWDDIGKQKTEADLVPAHNLQAIFKVIHNHLYTNSNLPRAERLGGEMVRLIFCKTYDELHNHDDLQFKAGATESDEEVAERVKSLFENVKRTYDDVFDEDERLVLDSRSIAYVVSELHNYSLQRTDKDAVGDAFEVFIGPALRGEKGQFFTPRNVVRLAVELVDPKPDEMVIDPACGSGGFLIIALEHVWKAIDEKHGHLPPEQIGSIKSQAASRYFFGIDKEFDLAKATKAYMAIVGDGRGGVFCADSLVSPEQWPPLQQERIKLGSFDVLLTNPPFGSKIPVTGESILSQYELGYKWRYKKTTGAWERTDQLRPKQVPQIVFIERCLQLLKDGGRLAIILPETYLHAPSSQYVLRFLQRWKVLHVVDLAHDTFRPHNNAKTVLVVLEKSTPEEDHQILFSIANTVGHDHNGRTLYKLDRDTNQPTEEIDDEIPDIIESVTEWRSTGKLPPSHLLFSRPWVDINQDVLVPRYYWRPYMPELNTYAHTAECDLIPMDALCKRGIIEVSDGHGSPPAVYKGTGTIPYVRVADIINLEVYKNPTALIPEDIYLQKKGRGIDLEVEDLLFVKRGSYRIGSVALISPLDKQVLLTKEILVFRVVQPTNEWDIDAYYLVYLLTHPWVKRQIHDKVLIETTLPNIAGRWRELLLPISKDKDTRLSIIEQVRKPFQLKWEATEKLIALHEGSL